MPQAGVLQQRLVEIRIADDNWSIGTAGNDTLRGTSSAEALRGRDGNDAYYVTDGDRVIELLGEGNDTVFSALSWMLAANIENLTLTGGDGLTGRGNSLGNRLTGNTGDNLLDGRGGADTMVGGLGDDIYVTDGGDLIQEAARSGIDLVRSSVTFTLGTNVENLTLAGGNAINGTGNTLANLITGNAVNNVLNGAGGNDTMVGGLGDDTYVTDGGDVLRETLGGGTDLVRSSVSLALGSNLENLMLTGLAAINGTGNGLANSIVGNGADNLLSGAAGNDTLDGGRGRDALTGGAGADCFIFDAPLRAAHSDRITDFSTADDVIWLENAIFTRLAVGTLQASAFRANTTGLAQDGTDRVIYETDTGRLYYDADGTGRGQAIVFATLSTDLALTNADFLVV